MFTWLFEAEPPVTAFNGLLTGTTQEYVVPTGTITCGEAFAGVIEKAVPLQIVALCAGTNAAGLTVTLIEKEIP